MANLSEKSVDELRELLDEYGIKHGPIVDSTRSLYEKKLREAMANAKKRSPDKTFYREEVEEEITYVARTPVRGMLAADSGAYMRSKPERTGDYHHVASYSNYSSSPPDLRGAEYDKASYSNYSSSPPDLSGGEYDKPYTYSTPTTYRSSYLNSTPVTSEDIKSSPAPPAPKSSGLVPPWIQVVFFLVLLIFLYIVFSSMESNEPIKGIA
uniref:LEM domain-containing protein n=1 Tax=Neogobius melanostomus TaxID=47308 RepID=A0A8C6WQG6_9GOBI